METILKRINKTEDLMSLNLEELYQLAAELRNKIIDTVSKNGGHLAPSLGVVELTLALYTVFNPRRDKIIWDVGHQAYAHKLLTGRKNAFSTLRLKDGITGFPKISESQFDAFGVGHASTSVSAATGMAIMRDIQGLKHEIIAIIGDGALTGGEAYEGLNHAGDLGKKIMVILNDNEMSIEKNIGALSEYLTRLRLNPQFGKAKRDIEDILKRIPHIGDTVLKTAESLKEGVKAAINPGSWFEAMGFTYIGPIDGHNIETMRSVFQQVKGLDKPVLIHVNTVKGKGYLPAEREPNKFHGVSRFNKETGISIKNPNSKPSYTDIFGQAMVELGSLKPNLVAITAAMASGTGLKKFGEVFPERFFDVGIAEEHAATMAAGIAANGGHPMLALYSTFAQRAYDQILHDICLQNLPVTLCLDRAGLVGSDGATHHGVFDYAYLRHIPNMVIMAPKDENELRNMLYTAASYEGPSAVRYPRGYATGMEIDKNFTNLVLGKGEIISQGKGKIAFLAVGSMVKHSLEAAKILEAMNIFVTVVNMRFIKPLDTDLLDKLAKEAEVLVTLEENVLAGGFGSAVLEYLSDKGYTNIKTLRFGIKDKFIEHGTCPELLELCGLLPKQIAERVAKYIGGRINE